MTVSLPRHEKEAVCGAHRVSVCVYVCVCVCVREIVGRRCKGEADVRKREGERDRGEGGKKQVTLNAT